MAVTVIAWSIKGFSTKSTEAVPSAVTWMSLCDAVRRPGSAAVTV